MPTPATPFLVIDSAVVERNLQRLSAYASRHGIGVRPHTKTHKSRRLARRQMEAGAVGLSVAKVGEAEVMAEAAGDLLLAYPAVDPARASGAARLARDIALRVAIDSTAAADALSAAAKEAGSILGILVDLDVGLGRTGLQTPGDARQLARTVDRLAALRLDGLFFYPGHIKAPPDEQEASLREIDAKVAEAIALWKRDGFEAKIVSGGSTPTAYQSHFMPTVTEIRPGTYIFNDLNTLHGGACALEDCAARIVCTVVSDAAPGQVVIDAGSKTLAADRCAIPTVEGHGHVVEYPRARVAKLTEEHGQVDVSRCGERPRIGERVTVIPNHICPCVNLQDRVWLRGEDGALAPLPVDARGKQS